MSYNVRAKSRFYFQNSIPVSGLSFSAEANVPKALTAAIGQITDWQSVEISIIA